MAARRAWGSSITIITIPRKAIMVLTKVVTAARVVAMAVPITAHKETTAEATWAAISGIPALLRGVRKVSRGKAVTAAEVLIPAIQPAMDRKAATAPIWVPVLCAAAVILRATMAHLVATAVTARRAVTDKAAQVMAGAMVRVMVQVPA